MMTKKRFVLLEPETLRLKSFSHLDSLICRTFDDIVKAVPRVSTSSIWISFGRRSADKFLQAATRHVIPPGRLLALKPPQVENMPLLSAFFTRMFGIGPGFKYLPDEELGEVLSRPQEEAKDRFIGGAVDPTHRAIGLIRGDVTMIVVPLAIFYPNRVTAPDPAKLAFTDYGQTVCLGDYEASTDSILYEADSHYRAKVNTRRREQEISFGASLRRLRQLKMLARTDFSPLSAKTIARIERNEIDRPHGRTMSILASRLGVKPKEIETY